MSDRSAKVLLGSMVMLQIGGSPGASAGQLAEPFAFCRQSIAIAARTGTVSLLRLHERCHLQQLSGRLSPEVVCDDSAVTPSDVARVEAKLRSAADDSCTGIAPATLGWISCPNPCLAPIADHSDVARCLTCLAGSEARDTASRLWGPLRTGGTVGLKRCARNLARSLRTVTQVAMKEQQRCQYLEDQTVVSLRSCVVDDSRGRIAHAYEDAITRIQRCEVQALDALGLGQCSGPATACFTETVQAFTSALYTHIYAGANATPTATATAPSAPTDTPPPPTPTSTPEGSIPAPSSTPADCGARAPVVDPPPALTNQLSITLTGTVYVHGPASKIRVCGTECIEYPLGTAHAQTQEFAIPVSLAPNTTTHFELCTINTICSDIDCITTPIAVTHQSEPIPTSTPTPTRTSTPTRTPTSCGAVAPVVDTVTSPTNLLEQTIRGWAHVTGARYLRVVSEAGSFGPPEFFSGFPITVTLLPNQVNHLQVCVYNLACGPSACTTTDYNGAPLEIVQQE